jgi:hypothetical protein
MESWPYPCDLRERQAGSTPSNEALGGRTHQFVDQRAQEVGVVYREGGSSHRLLARILRGDHNRGKAHQAGLDPLPLGGTTLSPTIAYWRRLLAVLSDFLAAQAGKHMRSGRLTIVRLTFIPFLVKLLARRTLHAEAKAPTLPL